MRKIIFILAVFLSAAIISCSGDSDSDVSVGYIDPGLSSAKQVFNGKEYTVAGNSCTTSGGSCHAVIFSGELNDVTYSGIAAGIPNSSFCLKIYWTGSFYTGNHTYSNATVQINSSTYTGTITLNIVSGTSSDTSDSSSITYYTITFPNSITTSDLAYTISTTDEIVAYKY